MNITIVMATYNGEQYIKCQLESILPYLHPEDEIIISDDGSTDGTLKYLYEISGKYSNIRVVKGPRKGVVKNFESALLKTNGDIIMFADQDDIWMPEKLQMIRQAFEQNNNLSLVLHNMFIASNTEIEKSEYGITSFSLRKRKHGVLYNLLYSGYYGCCMAFSRNFKEEIVPFSQRTNMYDQWIGLIAEHDKKSLFIEKPLIVHRKHGKNMSQKQTLYESLISKLKLYMAYRDFLRTRSKEKKRSTTN